MNTTTTALAKYIQANPDSTVFEFNKGKVNEENQFTSSSFKSITINGIKYKSIYVKSGDENLVYPVRKGDLNNDRQFVSGHKPINENDWPAMAIINKKIEKDFDSKLPCLFVTEREDGMVTTKIKLKTPVDVQDETNKNKIIKQKKMEDLDKTFSGCTSFGYIVSNPTIYENCEGAYLIWRPQLLIKKLGSTIDVTKIEFVDNL